MRVLLVISLLLASIAIGGCGGDGDAEESTASAASQRESNLARKVQGTPKPPPFGVPSGPPPKEVLIKDVKVGRGVEIEPRNRFTTAYVALDYQSGDPVEDYWQSESFNWCWRTGELTKGWEIGLEGMRVGGRRELIVPSNLAYESGARVYMIELLSVE